MIETTSVINIYFQIIRLEQIFEQIDIDNHCIISPNQLYQALYE